MTGEHTESIVSLARNRSRAEWTLVVALDSQDLATAPERRSLAGIGDLAIGRGPERALSASGGRARLELPDRWISLSHARLVRAGEGWTLEDAGSRNGCRVNGERVVRASVGDGDVLEIGGTFMVLRRAERLALNPEPLGSRIEALQTLSPVLEHELSVLRKVARSAVPVLVLGASGVGKEGIAGAVHTLSGRSGPLLAVNCGALPPTIIESELFGSKRGAFSGAEDRVGLVRSAEGGTLFLDEIAELPLSSQAALLRVLQEKELLPLGATRPVAVDVRVVAATNRPVMEFVDAGKLRPDLYARLRGYELRLPTLRERLEDLGLLIATLVRRHDRGGGPRTLSRIAARALFAHSWPLNIRELEQCLTAALAVAGAEIDLEHLPVSVRVGAPDGRRGPVDERERLLTLLRRHEGNLSAVARELATSRSQLYRLLARHSIKPEEA